MGRGQQQGRERAEGEWMGSRKWVGSEAEVSAESYPPSQTRSDGLGPCEPLTVILVEHVRVDPSATSSLRNKSSFRKGKIIRKPMFPYPRKTLGLPSLCRIQCKLFWVSCICGGRSIGLGCHIIGRQWWQQQ